MCGAFGTFAHQAYTARLRGQLSSNVRPHNERPLTFRSMNSFKTRIRKVLRCVAQWLRGSPVRMLIAVGLACSAYFLVIGIGPSNLSLSATTIRVAIAAFIFGIFLGAIYLSNRMTSPLEATLVRTIAGVIAGPAIAAVLGASAVVMLGTAILGGALGYFGMAWASRV